MGNPWNLDPKKIFIHFSNIAYNLKPTDSSVHEHIDHRQTKFCVQEIKWFHSIHAMSSNKSVRHNLIGLHSHTVLHSFTFKMSEEKTVNKIQVQKGQNLKV